MNKLYLLMLLLPIAAFSQLSNDKSIVPRPADTPAIIPINVREAAAAEPMQIHAGYSPQELAETFFFETVQPFISLTGATSSTGSAFGEVTGIAGFSSSLENFPLEGGIVLTTGDAGLISGHNELALNAGTGAWPATTDFEEIFGQEEQGNFVNESSFEFDFHLPTDMLEFSYVYASEDYGPNQCLPSDAIAIILTDLNTGVETNLAVIPGSIIPVNTNTVRDNAYNPSCPSENSNYFGEYYTEGDSFATTNFNGHTGRMDVSLSIVPFTNYHIKFVIADREESAGDSALFISWTYNIGEPTLAPTAISPQQFESGETLADIEIEGQNIQWYDNPGQAGPPTTADTDIPLPLSTVLVDGETYYASQTIDGIESLIRTAVTVHLTLALQENVFDSFMSFPNPVIDVLHITNSHSMESATIHNLMGQVVFSTEIDSPSAELNLSGLAKGMYFVTLKSGEAEKTIRIIKE